jgi:hypothetical protein
MKQLSSAAVAAPGFYGLNTQESGAMLSDGFALVASNCVIDKYGRLGARKGWVQKTTTTSGLNGANIYSLFEYLNADGTFDYLSAGNNKLWRGGIGAVLTDITPSMTITDNHWQMASLADHCLMTQKSHLPVFFTRESGSPVCTTIVGHGSGHGGAGFASPVFGTGTANGPNACLAAYGRFWVAGSTGFPTTVFWSTDIADSHFPTFDTGGARTSGSINIASKLPNNTDEIVALAAHNGFLIIFCKQNIVILSGAETPATTMTISDVIPGVGCIARDSVQKTGNDLLFLSASGVRSLGRTIQEKSMPMRDISKNVRDDLFDNIANTEAKLIKSCYSEKYGFYLLSFPSVASPLVYCFDLKQALPDGAARVTTWNAYPAYSFSANRDGTLYVGKPAGIGEYFGYQDNGSGYTFIYYTNYFDFGQPTINKIAKKIGFVLIGGGGQRFVAKLGFDYSNQYSSYPVIMDTGEYAEYNVAEYNIAEYSSGIVIDDAYVSVGGQGKIVQMGFEAQVSGSPLSVQKMDIFIKQGKIY